MAQILTIKNIKTDQQEQTVYMFGADYSVLPQGSFKLEIKGKMAITVDRANAINLLFKMAAEIAFPDDHVCRTPMPTVLRRLANMVQDGKVSDYGV